VWAMGARRTHIQSERKKTEVLSGWKEIANYLGKGVRTVQRYERQFRLPVRRPAGKARASVIATKAELDAWVNASPAGSAGYLLKLPLLLSPAWAAVKDSVAETRNLRQQLAASRLELRAAVAELRKSVRAVREIYADARWSNKGNNGLVQ
jgi:hypothetical protein